MISTLGVMLNNKCNLSCDYCYIGHGNESITFDKFSKALKYFISIYQVNPQLQITPCILFIGGEPLLDWALLKKCAKYAKRILPSAKIRIISNGLSLDPEKLSFINNNNIDLTLSLDGPASVHDKHRKIKPSMKGSLGKILQNIGRIPLRERAKISINTVIAPDDSCGLMRRLLFIRKKGFIDIRYTPVFQPSRWESSSLRKLEYYMYEFANKYCGLFFNKKINDIFVINFLKGALRTAGSKKRYACYIENKFHNCNAVWLDPSGNFYVCERILGMPLDIREKCQIGNVKDGIDIVLRNKLFSKARKQIFNSLSKADSGGNGHYLCPLPFYFRGTINNSFAMDNNSLSFYLRISDMYKKSLIKILETLKDNDLFKEIYNIN